MLRPLAVLALAVFCFLGSARAEDKPDTAKKLVGKWKITAVGDKKDDTLGKGIDFHLEFKADGTGAMRIESSDPKSAEIVKMLNDKMPAFKWSVTGDKLELVAAKKEDGLFGGKEKGTAKIKFDGDKLTVTPDDEKGQEIKLDKVKK